jgi:tetratricopeptide (TPR) repeat protein
VATEKADLDKARQEKQGVVAARRSYGGALRAYGAALYRAGQYQEAVMNLEEATANLPPRAWDWLFLAMAHHCVGDEAKARADFEKAVREITSAGEARSKDSTWFYWHEQVEVEALRREAETLLAGPR